MAKLGRLVLGELRPPSIMISKQINQNMEQTIKFSNSKEVTQIEESFFQHNSKGYCDKRNNIIRKKKMWREKNIIAELQT